MTTTATMELTDAQRAELDGYVADHGTEVVFCVALGMAAELGLEDDDALAFARQVDEEYGDGQL